MASSHGGMTIDSHRRGMIGAAVFFGGISAMAAFAVMRGAVAGGLLALGMFMPLEALLVYRLATARGVLILDEQGIHDRRRRLSLPWERVTSVRLQSDAVSMRGGARMVSLMVAMRDPPPDAVLPGDPPGEVRLPLSDLACDPGQVLRTATRLREAVAA